MSEQRELTGLSIALRVDARTREFEGVLGLMPDQGIAPIDPKNAHITLIDSEEAMIELVTAEQQENFSNVEMYARALLSRKYMKYWELHPSRNDVRPLKFKKRLLGIVLAEQGLLAEMRGEIIEIYEQEAGIRLDAKHDYCAHIRLGVKTDNYHELQKNKQPELVAPRVIKIGGYSTERRVRVIEIATPAEPFNDTQTYRNIPPRLYGAR